MSSVHRPRSKFADRQHQSFLVSKAVVRIHGTEHMLSVEDRRASVAFFGDEMDIISTWSSLERICAVVWHCHEPNSAALLPAPVRFSVHERQRVERHFVADVRPPTDVNCW